MKVLIIGATGRVGKLLTKRLLNENHEVVGTSRSEEKLFDTPNYNQINLDLLADVDSIQKSIPTDVDAIFFVSGSRGKNLLEVDLNGAVKTMQAAEKLNIKRYIMLSSIFSLSPKNWKDDLGELTDYIIAKHYADQWLINNTDLIYTILQPGPLTETTGTGKINVAVNSSKDNSIENVATTLYEVLNNTSTEKKVISMQDGETPIEQAISDI